MRIPALGSLHNLRRHLTPTARARRARGRLQGNVSTAIERPAPKGLAQLKLGPASNIVSSSIREGGQFVRHKSVYDERLPQRKPTSMDTRHLRRLPTDYRFVWDTYPVSSLSRFQTDPCDDFWLARTTPAPHHHKSSDPANPQFLPSPLIASIWATAGGE
jgi:hypothetical protein